MTPADTSSPIAVARTAAELRIRVQSWRQENRTIALVPTMGALHQGHISLLEIAKATADCVVVSIFVNPTQFAPHEDFDSYPRNEADDLVKLETAGAHLAYVPSARDIYPNGFTTTVSVSELTEGLCAATRPHFFDGVTTVVSKLLIHCAPDVAVFGEKDYQQFLVIRRMVEDLGMPVDVVAGPIVREADGLAVSSRNQYLDEAQRTIAGRFNKVLQEAAQRMVDGAPISKQIAAGEQALLSAGFKRVDYIELRDAETLAPVDVLEKPARLLSAVWLGETRLIDNWPVFPR